MRTAPNLIAVVAILLAGGLAAFSAVFAANFIEERASTEIRRALAEEEITWVGVEASGLQIRLRGTAETEALRFRALSIAGTIIDASRVIDLMDVTPAKPLQAPRFSLELLRNDDGVSMIGLIPAATSREDIATAVETAAEGANVTDMLDVADYAIPAGWDQALEFGLEALAVLPRSKISIAADGVSVTAISDSSSQKRKLESDLARKLPDGLPASIEISAPRPVITPFTLRMVIDADGTRFDACSADTEKASERILVAARAAGLDGKAKCTIGLGVPTPQWAKAVETGIKALTELGGGELTFSDADVTIVAQDTTRQALFDKVTGELESDLPEVFSLHSILPEPVKIDGTGEGDGPPEFVATLSPEGKVQLRGRVTDELVRSATESYARSRFGLNDVYAAMKLDEELPDGWPIRVLTALEALSELNSGSAIVQAEFIELSGVTGNSEANARIAKLFGEKLGEAQDFNIQVRYEEALDPVAALPSPQQCVDRINAILADQKITFAPGSVTVEGNSLKVIDRIADTIKECPNLELEIGGHTDSQGREEMNQQLSQQRADAVLTALISRRVLTAGMTAKGYGEAVPIATNDTNDGREANRRIEFTLIVPEAEEPAEADAAEDDTGEPQETPANPEPTTETEATDGQN
ncbi:OmpA family protein [Actibacterium lipolyticum]|uniref:Putative lipoprotein YiaD n=1 Tax=Actibacterium lipolyticum TaxID=1524263 RepID=A0A238KSL7_9RHOB|nr:OmpA family protein [Actibacterium lipolyticum]SMX45844.1 putative lipoprotein YiaD precursor [Actibacterium lipolyticum]